MSRAHVTLRSRAERDRAKNWIEKAPTGTRVEFKAARRSLPQNDRLWAMLTDIAGQLEWYGKRLNTNQWKLMFIDALNTESEMMPSIDGCHMVNVGRSSSDLSKQEFGELLEIIACFGAEHGVVFHDPAMEPA